MSDAKLSRSNNFLTRIYCPVALAPSAQVELPNAQAHHAVRVLRLDVGDRLVLFNGQGGEAEGEIVGRVRNRVTVAIQAVHAVERESRIEVTLIQGLSSTDKMDLVVQKAVELGVRRIIPAVTGRSVVRLSAERAAKRLAHWQGVVIAACEQCGRNYLPAVDAPAELRAALDAVAALPARWVLSPAATRPLREFSKPAGGVALLVGAEGGFTPQEEGMIAAAGFVPVGLGPRVLRTETAGLAALAAIQALWGD